MTLTVVIGSSGSGKTTFLEDVYKLNNAVYIRQYHTLRPYIPVRKIPSFDPTRLPFWKLYSQKASLDGDDGGKLNESYNPLVKIGGTMAGEFTPGLSGGQRKMMLFELVCQRVAASSDLLVCLDEPFAGVTEDFVPFIVDRLNALRKTHNVLLVTNDHVHTLTEMADSTITVSAIDRSLVKVNRKEHSREVCLHAVASGKQYAHSAGNQDLWFFFDTEILSNPALFGVFGFTVFAMLLFLLTFWNSQAGQEILVIVALQIVCFFALNPYLIALPDWRNTMREEAEALMHCSVETNLALKSCIVLLLLIAISGCAFGVLNACMDSLDSAAIWAFMLFDSASLTLPFICFGLYSMLPLQVVQIVASLPFLFMIFFSTTFSPGAGVEGVKALRYLFARFYFWCYLPQSAPYMDECPPRNQLLPWAVLTGCLGLILFVIFQVVRVQFADKRKEIAAKKKRNEVEMTPEFTLAREAMFRNEPSMRSATANSDTANPVSPQEGAAVEVMVNRD